MLLVNFGRGLKIGDFGLSREVTKASMTCDQGSDRWMAPERFKSTKYNEKCDVYSWAIILWEVLARKKPYHDIDMNLEKFLQAVSNGARLTLIQNCPHEIKLLLNKCWSKDLIERPSIVQVEEEINEIFNNCDDQYLRPIF